VRSRADSPRVIERLSERENREASNSVQHVVSKGNARSLRVHDYRGAQGGKKLAKLSVRHKRTSKRGLYGVENELCLAMYRHCALSQVTVAKPSRPEDNLLDTAPGLKT
jgi:hypothetical protein